ncbi:MAG: hypothetical protein IT577_20675 [Verrucomicrobiae bacterium]|nr:hypothetical protein [Verrucomicrobiae bacterium]
MPRISDFLKRRPCLRDALCWSAPALVAGLIVRWVLLDYSPFALWTKDSYSFMNFAARLFLDHAWHLEDKRRWTYPIALAFSWILPGGCLKWVAVGQHAAGLLGVLCLGWIARRCFDGWRMWIVPLTTALSLAPDLMFYEHSVLAESLFLNLGILSMAGWVKWCMPHRDPRQFWHFFAPFALLVLCKPAGRFLFPGLVAGLLFSGLWRGMSRRQAAALVALALATATVGTEGQGARLLLTTVFPAMRLDTPRHAEYKAQVRDLVARARAEIHAYHEADSELGIKSGLDSPASLEGRPLWQELGKKGDAIKAKRYALFKDLALEALLHEPWLAAYVAAQRIVASSIKAYSSERIGPGYQAERMARDSMYPEYTKEHPELLRALYGIPRDGPMPALDFFCRRVSPKPDSRGEGIFESLGRLSQLTVLAHQPPGPSQAQPIYLYRPTVFGLLVLAGLVLAARRPHRAFFAAWALVQFSYLFGVFTLGSTNPRYFSPAYPFLLIVAVLPLDSAWAWLRRRLGRARSRAAEESAGHRPTDS